MLTGRIRRKERSFYGAEPALGEKLIRDRYQGLGRGLLLAAGRHPAQRAFIDSISGRIERDGTHSAGAVALSASTSISLSHVRASDGQFASAVFATLRPKAWPPCG